MESNLEKFDKKTKYDNQKQAKLENYKYLNERYPSDNCTVLIGDSIVEHWSTELFKNYSRATGQEVINRGISGDTSDRMFERLYQNAINLKPANIVILIGTNDIGIGVPDEITLYFAESSIKLIKKELPKTKIILISLLPVNKKLELFGGIVGKRSNELIEKINIEYKALCEKYNIEFLDINDKLKDKKGRFDKNYTYDGLHPNIKGYVAMTPDLIDLLK